MTHLTPEKRAELRAAVEERRLFRFATERGSDGYPSSGLLEIGREVLALLDAADERDKLAAAAERVRALADNWERLDRALLAAGAAGMSMPAVDAVRQLRERLSALDGTDGPQ